MDQSLACIQQLMDTCNVCKDRDCRFHKDFRSFWLRCWTHSTQPEEEQNNPKRIYKIRYRPFNSFVDVEHTRNKYLSVLTLIEYRPGSRTIGDGVSPFAPDTVTN